MENIENVLIHDSASTFGDIFLINQWHKERNFRWRNPKNGLIINCGYHYVIYNGRLHSKLEYEKEYDGLIVPGRPEGERGAHCLAKGMNGKSIGICLIGDGKFTNRQGHKLVWLVSSICEKYDIPAKNILGHKEVDSRKLDPRFNMDKLRSRVSKKLKYGMGN